MHDTKRVPTQYVSELGDYFTFPSVNDDTLEAIWKKITVRDDYCMYLVIGFYHMNVSDDMQAAWTLSSYIITAGAFLIPVLAVLTTLQDGGDDLVQTKKHIENAGFNADSCIRSGAIYREIF